MPDKNIKYDSDRDTRIDSDGQPYQDLPKLTYQAYEEWGIEINKMVAGVRTPQDLSDAVTWECAVFRGWAVGTDAGALTSAYSGVVTEIVADTFSETPPAAGFLILTNAAGEFDQIYYSSYTVDAGEYTFTVNGTLTYSYSIADVCTFEISPPAIRVLNANIDSTAAATGIIAPTLDADNPIFLAALEGEKSKPDAFLELKGYLASGKRKYYFLLPIEMHAVGDPITNSEAQPVTNFNTKAQDLALFMLKNLVDETTGQEYEIYFDNGEMMYREVV